MPLDMITLIEGLGATMQLLPSDYEIRYRALALSTAQELISALEPSGSSAPFCIEKPECERFQAAKSRLVDLISNPPSLNHPIHEGLKPLLTKTLRFSRSLTSETCTTEQTKDLLQALRLYVTEYRRQP